MNLPAIRTANVLSLLIAGPPSAGTMISQYQLQNTVTNWYTTTVPPQSQLWATWLPNGKIYGAFC